MATFFAALAQAIATTAALWLLGFDHLFIIFVVVPTDVDDPDDGHLAGLAAVRRLSDVQRPLVQATLLCIYGALFVGMLDNVVRTYILNTDVKLHPLLALISVLAACR